MSSISVLFNAGWQSKTEKIGKKMCPVAMVKQSDGKSEICCIASVGNPTP
jgi:hypothetical protein